MAAPPSLRLAEGLPLERLAAGPGPQAARPPREPAAAPPSLRLAEGLPLERLAAGPGPQATGPLREFQPPQRSEETRVLQESLLALREGMLRNENLFKNFEHIRSQDEKVRREMDALQKQDAELRRENTQLRRALLRGPGRDEEVVEDITEDDPVVGETHHHSTSSSSIFSSRVFWVVITGCCSILVCCICFWVLEFTYLHNFDVDGDGEVETEEILIKMQNFMTVSYTSLRAVGVLVVISIVVGIMLWWAGIIQAMIAQLLVYLFLAVALASCLSIFVYNIYLNITSMLGSLFKELKDMIQGVVNFLEEKTEAAAEQMEKITGSMGFLAQDGPGMYAIKSRCDLQKTEKLDSQILEQLQEGTLVNILKVKTRLADSRIRGLAESPKGWISIQDLETGFRWAQKREYQRGYFKVTANSIPVTSEVEIDSPPSFKPFVKKGDLLRVREIRHRLREGAVRGNISDGWITLLDTRTGRHNVEPWSLRSQDGIVPSFATIAAMATGGAAPSPEAAPEDDLLEGDDPQRMQSVREDPFLTQDNPAARHDQGYYGRRQRGGGERRSRRAVVDGEDGTVRDFGHPTVMEDARDNPFLTAADR